MFEAGIKHTHLTGPWHYCDRCDAKTKIAIMKWQRGLLLCPICVDRILLGQREVAIAQVLEDGKEEFAPVDKIKNPSTFEAEEDFLV